jgi:hypothetical protein
MPLTLRPGKPEDAAMCSLICYEAFKTIAEQHNFPSNYPSPEVAVARMEERLSHPGLYAVVAELDGCVVGSNFLDERGLSPALARLRLRPLCKTVRSAGTSCRRRSSASPHGAVWGCDSSMRPITPAR